MRLRFVLSAALALALVIPAAAHQTVHCAAMRHAIAAMQGEVDGLRQSARSLRRAGDRRRATELVQRAEVEQARIDGLRHNLKHCSNETGHDHTD